MQIVDIKAFANTKIAPNFLISIAMQKKCLLHLHIHILTIFLLTHLILISLRTPSFAFLPPLLIVIRQVNLGTVLARL